MRVTKADMVNRVRLIEDAAREIGLIDQSTYLLWSPGSVTNGVSPEVTAYSTDTVGRRVVRVSFLPKFTYKTTQIAAWNILGATVDALESVRDHLER